jgi:hypothetical protein
MGQTQTQTIPVVQPELPGTGVSEWSDVCGDRNCEVWRKFRGGDPSEDTFRYGMMFNVAFRSKADPSGCGGLFTGHAEGDLIEKVKPTEGMLAKVRRLIFDAVHGIFRDAETKQRLRTASVLILKDGLRSGYIP